MPHADDARPSFHSFDEATLLGRSIRCLKLPMGYQAIRYKYFISKRKDLQLIYLLDLNGLSRAQRRSPKSCG